MDGFLQAGCTVVVPAFSYSFFAVPPPPDSRPARNAWSYDSFDDPKSGIGRVYGAASTDVDSEMGIIPATIVRTSERMRGNHPLNSFAAVGPLAADLVSSQAPLDVYAPLKALARTDGYVVLAGVGLDRMTLVHLAEEMAGRNLFIRWANGPDGRPMAVKVGGCSRGFGKLEPVLSSLMNKGQVGESVWLVYPAKATLEAARDAIRDRPELTRCGVPQCDRCSDAINGGPIDIS